MTWLKLDDGFAEHDKILPLSDRAFRLHVVGMLACARNLTDGFVSDARFVSVAATSKASRKHADELEAAGLWRRLDAGWQIRDYLDYNPSAEHVRSEREKMRQRQAASRARREAEKQRENGHVTRDTTRDTTRDNSVSHAAPTRPDPTRTTTESVVDVDPSFLQREATDGKEGRSFNLQAILGDVA